MELFDDLHDLNNLLKDIQKTSKALFIDTSKPISCEAKRSKSSSAWAKSSSIRNIHRKISNVDIITDDRLKDGERITKYQPPAYSIGKPASHRKQSIIKSPTLNSPPPTAYDVKISSSSRYKRPKTSTFGTSPKGDESNMVPISVHPEIIIAEPACDVETRAVEYNIPNPRSYSFGTAERIKNPKPLPTGDIPAPLDIDRANKWVYDRPSTPLMMPDVVSKKIEPSSPSHKDDMTVPVNLNVNVEVLSHVIKSSTPTMRPPHPKSSQLLSMEASKLQHTTNVGPGYYILHDDMTSELEKKKLAGRIYSKPSPEAEIALLKKNIAELSTIKQLGPGYYDVEKSVDKLRTKSPATIISKPKNDDDVSIHLQRKRYLEEKSADARSFHDNQAEVKDHFLYPRAPVPIIPSINTTITSDPKLHRIHQQREADRMSEETSRIYDVNHELYEKRPAMMVNMDAEVKARESMQKLLANKPGVKQVLYEKIASHDVLYGPQLPVAWVPDRLTQQRATSPASPTQEVMKLLRRDHNYQQVYESITATAYQRSSHAGSLSNKPTAIMRDDQPTVSKRLPEDKPQIEPLGLIDWTQELNRREAQYKSNSLRMDMHRGRDDIRIHGKGQVEVIAFDKASYPIDRDHDDDYIVPSYHIPEFGADTKGVVRFEKITARDDNVGPNGERPANSTYPIDYDGYVDDYHDGYRLDKDRDYVLDNDHIIKKKVPSITLYRKERFVEKKVETSDIGGAWFKGMAEEISQRHAVIDYSKMHGRSYDDDHDDIDEDEGRILDLQVPDHKDIHKKQQSKLHEFKDPDRYPRFDDDHDDADNHVLDLHPKYDYLNKHSNANQAAVRMDRMIGRSLYDDENDDMVNTKDIVSYDKHQAENIIKAKDEISSKSKRSATYVNMDKQIGRHDDTINNHHHLDDELMIDEQSEDIHIHDHINRGHIKDVVDWSKHTGRDDDIITNTQVEAIMLDLDNIQPHAQSKFKRVSTGAAWKHEDEENRFAIAKPLAAPDAIYDDVDVGKFKKGLHPIGSSSNKHQYNMNHQLGRGGDNDMMADDDMEILDIEPKDHNKPRVRGAMISSTNHDMTVPSGIMDPSIKLDLDIKDPKLKKPSSAVMINKQASRRRSSIPVSLRAQYQPEEVIIDPQHQITSQSKKITAATIAKHDEGIDNFYIIDDDPYIADKPPVLVPSNNKSSSRRTTKPALPSSSKKSSLSSSKQTSAKLTAVAKQPQPPSSSTSTSLSVPKPKDKAITINKQVDKHIHATAFEASSPPDIAPLTTQGKAPEEFHDTDASINDLFQRLDQQLHDLKLK